MTVNIWNGTHRCEVCGAIWRLNEPTPSVAGTLGREPSWTLVSSKALQCCDNAEFPPLVSLPIPGVEDPKP